MSLGSTTAIALLLAAGVCALPALSGDELEASNLFESFKMDFNRTYSTVEEHALRFEAFKVNLAKIDALNVEEGEEVYGVNKFSDLTADEFKQKYLGYKPSTEFVDVSEIPLLELDPTDPAVNASGSIVDWRQKGVVTPVKDQQQCGSCWAFSATEEIESAWLMAGNKKQILAPEQIVACDKKDLGCNGGDTPTAYKYVMKAGGMVTEETYPYSSGKGKTGKCKKGDLSPKVVTIKGFSYATPPKNSNGKPNENKMAAALASKGPLSVCVDAESWQQYKKGVVTRTCKKQLDHCVQAVGYNKKGPKPYWIVRNSWNTDWGVDGYIYVGMGHDYCGIANEATIVQV